MRLRVGARTDVGRVRELNEDAYLLMTDQRLFLVCDGMGGAPAGEVASDMAAQAIRDELADAPAPSQSAAADDRGFQPQTARLAGAIRRANQRVYDQGQQDPGRAGMGTTIVGAWVNGQMASVAHVGDSRAYLWHAGHLEQLTRDHSLAEAQRDAGGPVSDAAPEGAQNILLRVLGRTPDVDVDLSEVALQPADYLLLCSDGLTRMVSDDFLNDTIGKLRDPQRICDYLVDAANVAGGHDNVTVVVVQMVGSWWRRLSGQ
jgi:protein phosphatase